jgi:hypothetical protein
MINIAICYWGMTRSVKQTYKSHIQFLYNVLDNNNNNITYKKFMHTWETDTNMIWGKNSSVAIDYDEYKLLNPHYYTIDCQDDFLNTLTETDYFNRKLYNIYGGDTHHEWRPELIRNHLCALESQKRVTNMVQSSGFKFDYIIYIRPDVELITPFLIQYLNINNNEIAIPNEHHYSGYNDRFAIVPYTNCSVYGKRIDEIIQFRKKNGRIVSEKYVKFILLKYFSKIHFIDFKMEIVRPVEINTQIVVKSTPFRKISMVF